MNLPASIWGFFAEASSVVSVVAVLNRTGPFAMEPGIDVFVGSRRFAYSDRPPGRGGGGLFEELFCDILVDLCASNEGFRRCYNIKVSNVQPSRRGYVES